MTPQEQQEHLAFMCFARSYLHLNSMLSVKESDAVHQRIMKWQDKNKVAITEDQLAAVEMVTNTSDESLTDYIQGLRARINELERHTIQPAADALTHNDRNRPKQTGC